jgi:hypothetical protein
MIERLYHQMGDIERYWADMGHLLITGMRGTTTLSRASPEMGYAISA